MCKTIMSLLFLLAGLVLAMGNPVAGMPPMQLAGVLFVLVGLGKLIHCMGMCSMCKNCCMPEKEMMDKKRK